MSAGGQQRADPPPWTGPWADDARRLFQILQTATEPAGASSREGPSSGRASSPSAESSESTGWPGFEHPPECRYCPFCQGVALLRRAGRVVRDQVSEFAAGLAATLRATQPAAARAADESSTPADSSTDARVQPPSTVRIDVTD